MAITAMAFQKHLAHFKSGRPSTRVFQWSALWIIIALARGQPNKSRRGKEIGGQLIKNVKYETNHKVFALFGQVAIINPNFSGGDIVLSRAFCILAGGSCQPNRRADILLGGQDDFQEVKKHPAPNGVVKTLRFIIGRKSDLYYL